MNRALLCLALVASPVLAAVDLVDQKLEVDLTRSDTSIDVTSTLSVKATSSSASVELLAPTVPVDAAWVNGAPAAFVVGSSGQRLSVTLPQALSTGDQATLKVHYAGTPGCTTGGRRECSRTAALTFFGQISQTTRWYLASYGPIDRFTSTIDLRVPDGWTAATVQPSVPGKNALGDGTTVWHFSLPYPTDQLALLAGPLEEVTSADGFVHGHVLSATTKPLMQRAVDDVARAYPVMKDFYGPLPLQQFHVTFVPSDFIAGGVGNLGLVFLSELLAAPSFQYILAATPHELAHSWWGNLSAPDTYFLSEAMAEYSYWRAVAVLDGEQAAAEGRRMNAVWYLFGRTDDDDPPILSPQVAGSSAYVHVTYHKGSVVIRTLEQLVGAEAMGRALKTLAQTTPSLTVDAWLAAIHHESGVDLSAFRTQWLETAGWPSLIVSSHFTPTPSGGQLELELFESQPFPMKLPVLIRDADGTTTTKTLAITAGVNHLSVPLKGHPLAVQVDPQWNAVREVRPGVEGDVTCDGELDGADLVEVALHVGGKVPPARRMDGHYDPLFDLDANRAVDLADLEKVKHLAEQ